MQKFLLKTTQAGPGCRDRKVPQLEIA
jgi:hypothetical protein